MFRTPVYQRNLVGLIIDEAHCIDNSEYMKGGNITVIPNRHTISVSLSLSLSLSVL